jgi:hypothetical protein
MQFAYAICAFAATVLCRNNPASFGLAEGIFQEVEPRLRQVLASAIAQGAIERSRETTGQSDQPLAMGRQHRRHDARILAQRHAEIGVPHEPHEVALALFVLSQQYDIGRLRHHAGDGIRLLEAHRELDTHDRLDAEARELLGEFEGAEEIVGVGERERRLSPKGGKID